MEASGAKSVYYATTNLFRVAAIELGDATQWYRIAQANGMADPWFQGQVHLIIPPKSTITNGGILE